MQGGRERTSTAPLDDKGAFLMPNKASLEVIDGVQVIRYNGNNCTGSRAAANAAFSAETRNPKARSARITAWRKKKAQEDEYRWRYLGGK